MAKKPLKMGKVQFQIMQVLWQRGPCTAREITEELSRTTPTAHSTVQTLLRQLEAKGAIAHEKLNRTFVFRPLYQQNEVAETPLRDLLMRVYHGSIVNLMSHLLTQEKISEDELARLRQLLEEESKK
jgi:BlaI family penicillinase repressor